MYVVRVYAPGLCVALRAGVSRRPFPSLQHAPRRDFTASIKECFSLGSMHRTSPQNVMSTHACARARTHTHTHEHGVAEQCVSTLADQTVRDAQPMPNTRIAIVVAPEQDRGSAAGVRGRGPLPTTIRHSADHASLRGRGPLPTPARSPAAHCRLR